MTRTEALIEKAVAGAMGKEVIIREIRGKIVVTDKPEFKERVLSKKQDLVTVHMIEANQYAKGIMSDENLRNAAQIRFNVTRERLYNSLVSEYWKTHWERVKKKQEAEDEIEKEKLRIQKIANGDSTSNVDSTKSGMDSENNNNKPGVS